MKKWMALVLCVLMLGAMAACGAAEETMTGATPSDAVAEYKYKTEDHLFATGDGAMFDNAASLTEEPMLQEGESVYQNASVKLIRRANLQVQTVEFDASVAALEQLVLSLNGYYESAELYSGGYYNRDGYRSGRYVVRIPADAYDSFMNQIGGVGHLAMRSESTQDVGQAYFDTESRLNTQRTKQERLQYLLKQAQNMEDIIALENALADVEYQIEQYTSQLRRYDSLIGYATIEVSLEEMQRITDDPGQQAGLLQRMKNGVVSSAGNLVDGLQDLLVWVSYNVIGIAVFVVALAVGWCFIRTRIKGRKAKKAAKDEDGELER